MICVEIDELTNCLRNNATGELVETIVIRMNNAKELSKYNKSANWYTNWRSLLKENEIYAIALKENHEIQGLIAVHSDEVMKTSFIAWMVAAPHNNPEKLEQGMVKRYNGVGGHLFAIAAQKSCEYGYGGAISGFAADEKLVKHYCKVFNAEHIGMLHPYQIFIPEEN